ncbi:MAG: hypothetical protein KIT83_10355 [Bryobacterales bacterium]|nr:hypothetical protein [Bryobacterales bacterium]
MAVVKAVWSFWVLGLMMAGIVLAQPLPNGAPGPASIGLTPFGNTLVQAGVAGYATGPVARVWRTSDGAEDLGSVAVRLEDGSTWQTRDFALWTALEAADAPELPASRPVANPPSDAWLVQPHPLQPAIVYALGQQVYRSLDGGRSFAGLTRYRGVSLLGESMRDLLLNPADPEDLLVASDLGLWRSRDGGLSWLPVATNLENLPMARIVAFPEGRRGMIVEQPEGALLEWVPGSVNGWRPRIREASDSWAKPAAVSLLGELVAAWDTSGGQIYVGLQDGRLLASPDQGRTWREYAAPGWLVASQIVANPEDSQMALALAHDETGRPSVLRTLNGGLFWDDHTPPGASTIQALAADWEQGTLLLAADEALLVTDYDFRGMSRPGALRRLAWEGFRGEVRDMKIDPSGTLLFILTGRAGVYYAPLPAAAAAHRVRHAADLSRRPAAPGDLLSIHGAPLLRMRANGRAAAIVALAEQATQVQLPYALVADRIALELEVSEGASRTMAMPMQRVSPAVFLHPDGSPFVLHANTGALIDENFPASPGERIQVMVSGLGAVRPDWPAGLPVPADAPPAVIASVEGWVNLLPVRVERATLAPGYAGIYLVELVLPAVMDEGLAELQVTADGFTSNSVALHVAYP